MAGKEARDERGVRACSLLNSVLVPGSGCQAGFSSWGEEHIGKPPVLVGSNFCLEHLGKASGSPMPRSVFGFIRTEIIFLLVVSTIAPAWADNLAPGGQYGQKPGWNPKFGRNSDGSVPGASAPRAGSPAGVAVKVQPPKPAASTPAGGTPAVGSPDDSHTPRLKATAVHSETLPALPFNYQIGASVDDRRFAAQPPKPRRMDKKVFQIPDWLAGTWQRAMSTEQSRIELPSGKKLKTTGQTEARSTDRFGSYQDKSGQVWQIFDPARATGEVDRGTVMDCHVVTGYNLESVDNKSVSVEVQAYHLVVSKDGRRIVHSYQDEELNTYSLVVDGVVKTDSSVKVFDAMGKPKLLTRSVSQIRRIKPFAQ